MILSEFLGVLADAHGAESLEGALVFVMLERPLDELISRALALGPYHRGRPSPWSHCFLLAEPYRGKGTRILDCSIRDGDGRVEWDASLTEMLEILREASVGRGAGGIYDATIEDYDDTRVTARGARFLPGLTPEERRTLVEQGLALKQAGVRYDLPGLARELVRLLTGIVLPPANKRLFCSAFLQALYRGALGNVGDFAPKVRDEDTTPDDLWYSHKGFAATDVSAGSASNRPEMVRAFGSGARVRSAALPGLAGPPARAVTRAEISRALAKLESDPKHARSLEAYDLVRHTLETALAQLDAPSSASLPDKLRHADELELALVHSALSAPKEPTLMAPLLGREIVGFHQYEDLDGGWLGTLFHFLTRSKVPFPASRRVSEVVYEIPDRTSLALAGDWGTGNESSRRIAAQMRARAPDYTIHLGDVYYSGTESEESERLLALWPAGKRGSLTLNSNHEMYSGGHGYFGVALSHSAFRLQRGYSYFALSNANWLVIGLDSAYAASDFYQTGALNDEQCRWLRALATSDEARARGARKRLMILTHHDALALDGTRREPLFSQVSAALAGVPERWYWGHVHGAAVFSPLRQGGFELGARLVGHGGVPYAPDAPGSALVWSESELAGDSQIPERGRNGFAWLDLDGERLDETFYDELGNARWESARGPFLH